MKKLSFYPVFLFAFVLIGSVITTQAGPSRDLTILFTHDMHSNLDEYAMPSDDNNIVVIGGYARLAAAIENDRKNREGDTLVIDAGDFSMGTLFNAIRSAHSPELIIMGLMGYDATTFGNHEFEFGPEDLGQALLAAKKDNQGRLPAIVASNIIVDPQEPELATFRQAYSEYPVLPYIVIERAGLKIGIFGLMGKNAALYAPEAKPVAFSDAIDVSRKTVAILRDQEKVDMVICLSHSGTWKDKAISEDEILAKEAPGIDVIISGHTHSVLNPYIQVGNTYIVSADCYARYLGRLILAKNTDGSFKALDYKLMPITSALPEDPKIAGLIKSYEKDIDKEYLGQFNYYYDQALAEVPFNLTKPDWDKSPDPAECMTSGLGDLVTDAFRYAVKKVEGEDSRDIALAVEGFGHIRVPLAKGKLTVNDVFRLMALGLGPDGKTGAGLVTFWLTGDEIRRLFELETTLAPIYYDMHLQITGMRVSYDPKGEPFARVRNVEVQAPDGSWLSLEDGRLYRVCTDWKVILMRSSLEQMSGGKIAFVLKDEAGKAIDDIRTARVFTDTGKPLELKVWLAIAMYLESFTPGEDGLPQVPVDYRRARVNFIKTE
ncbi:MAG: 5'-nucleotidase C-terminal domain-containing protein [Candidatus Omnitrophica bacterium]|nr:5'-nucleotidase C-terminal domain-containing protein [Candidatus Omnitrophota bacterium]